MRTAWLFPPLPSLPANAHQASDQSTSRKQVHNQNRDDRKNNGGADGRSVDRADGLKVVQAKREDSDAGRLRQDQWEQEAVPCIECGEDDDRRQPAPRKWHREVTERAPA